MGRYISKTVREEVYKRDRGRCQSCGRTDDIEFDYLTPFSKGAPATAANLQLLCHRCNKLKRDKTKKCPKCSSWIPHDAVFCQACGRSIPNSVRKSQVIEPRSRWSFANWIGLLMLIAIGLYVLGKWASQQLFGQL